MTEQGRLKFKVWGVLLCVFLVGGATGAALDAIYRLRANAERPERPGRGFRYRGPNGPNNYAEALRRDLKLSDDQASKLRAVFDEARKETHALRAGGCPGFDALRQKTDARIRALLSPDQQQRYDAMVAERDAKHEFHDTGKP